MKSKLQQVISLLGLGSRRVIGRLRGAAPGRMGVCILGVALAVGLLFVVTGISLGLADSATVESEDIDYWIVPDESGAGSVPLQAEGARLGDVHNVTERLSADDRIAYASPVVLQPVRLTNQSGGVEYVVAVGVIPDDNTRRVADLNISYLSSSYSYYADGQYNGEWSGDTVISPAVAERLNVQQGANLTLGRDSPPLTVVGVNDRELSAGFGEVPAIVMPLAELQSVTGLSAADEADQILVATTDPSVESTLTDIYPQTSVVSRAGLGSVQTTSTSLPLAMALAAALVAGGIGVAFVATMMGLELTAGRQELAVLSAIGFSGPAQALVVAAETITVAVFGGIAGVLLGIAGTVAVNTGVASGIGVSSLGTISLPLVVYAFGMAIIVGVCAIPYPLYLTMKTNTLEELTQ